MPIAWHIEGSAAPCPPSRRTIRCDGGRGDGFREGVDLHLSHWVPNATPPRYKADSSTAICLNFAAEGPLAEYDLVVNDHVDVDGTLSVFSLTQPQLALAHRDLLVAAAEMGDFWAWAEGRAAVLAQALTMHLRRAKDRGLDAADACREGLALVARLLGGGAAPADVEPGLAALRESARLIDSGIVRRRRVGKRLTAFEIPESLSRGQLERCLHVPAFGTPLSGAALLWPPARARGDDALRPHLVSVQAGAGWHHDLWLPAWCWAETPVRGSVPGVRHDEGVNLHRLDCPPLAEALARLQADETAPGRWCLAELLSPFRALEGRGFPVVASFMADGRPAASALPPAHVAERLGAALDQAGD